MSNLRGVLRSLALGGVEFARLGELIRIKNGRDYKHLGPGDVPVYGTGGVMTHVDTATHSGPSVLIPRKGSLSKLYYVDRPFWTVDTIFYSEVGERVEAKFIYYYLLTQRLEELNKAGGVPSLTQGELNQLRVPVPRLEVQREIVRVLDNFTELQRNLEVELEAELDIRRRQHAHFRDRLLADASTDVVWIPMGEAVGNLDRQRRPVTRSDRSAGLYPYYGANGVQDLVDDYLFEGTFLLMGEDGSVAQKNGAPVLNWATGKIWVNNHAHVLTEKSADVRLRFVFHYLQTVDIRGYVTGGTQPKLNQGNMNRIPIPVPSIEEQDRVVDLLDQFDARANDLSIGLHAELAARRKQYEYYRDKLLTFEEAAA